MAARETNPAEVTSKVYVRGQNRGIDERANGSYRIPPGYRGNAFPEPEEVKVHTPQIYSRENRSMRTEDRQGIKVYSPRQREVVTDPPYRESTAEPIVAREEGNAEPEVPYDADFAADATDTADPVWDETMAELSDKPAAAMVQERCRQTEENRWLGEVFSTLFRNLRREDWLLVALIALFLLDGSASPDVLLLLAVLLAYHV